MTTPPGWHPDPHQAGQLRYWNGSAWTEHVAEGSEPVVPPKVLKQQAKEREAYLRTPLGQAESAAERGDRFFQVEIPHSDFVMPILHNYLEINSRKVRRNAGAPDLLGKIEQLGWHLVHADWLFIQSGAVSRDRTKIVSGQSEVTTVTGHVVGIYLFRRSDDAYAD